MDYGPSSLKKGVSGIKSLAGARLAVFPAMSVIDGISPSSSGLSLRAAKRARDPEKTRPASGLHSELEDEAHALAPVKHKDADQGLDHSGTEDAVPFRNMRTRSSLNPPFAAQLLGQVMPNPEQSKSLSAVCAYKEIARRLKLYDRIL